MDLNLDGINSIWIVVALLFVVASLRIVIPPSLPRNLWRDILGSILSSIGIVIAVYSGYDWTVDGSLGSAIAGIVFAVFWSVTFIAVIIGVLWKYRRGAPP